LRLVLQIVRHAYVNPCLIARPPFLSRCQAPVSQHYPKLSLAFALLNISCRSSLPPQQLMSLSKSYRLDSGSKNEIIGQVGGA